MENTGNKCYMCRSFVRYYTRGRIQFNQTKYGWCRAKLCDVKGAESCCQFKHKVRTKRSREILRLYLSNLLTEISQLKCCLKRRGMKTCKTCEFCYRLYMRYAWKYDTTKSYYCEERDEIITQFSICKKWRGKILNYDVSAERLNSIQEDIKRIIELLSTE